jgi:hypothetical protein
MEMKKVMACLLAEMKASLACQINYNPKGLDTDLKGMKEQI